ncbi:MAG TPA: hypothetical protein VHN14_35520 [Kofleriaceae bacterium]|jgi:hypothetical protein|nr:hypothetical protein [Kofleriaceae bacterium]
MAASGGALDGAELPPIDVLIVVALEAELDAVLAEGGGADGWRKLRDHVHVRTLPNGAGRALGVAAAWTGAMGAMATAARAAPLVEALQPSCLAMCGICAGKRGDVALGDVIVADRVYSFDHGKLVAAEDGKGPPSFFHDFATYNLERTWHMDAAAFRRDLGWAKELLPLRPPDEAGAAAVALAHPPRARASRWPRAARAPRARGHVPDRQAGDQGLGRPCWPRPVRSQRRARRARLLARAGRPAAHARAR